MKRKNPWIAFLLSILSLGLGQLYNHQIKKAILVFITMNIYVNILIFTNFLKTFPNLYISLILSVGGLLYIFIDAIVVCRKTKEVDIKKWDKWYIYVAIISIQIAISILFYGTEVKSKLPVQSYIIPTSSMEPSLLIHDVFTVDKEFESIELGDIIAFISPTYNQDIFIKRCLGLPGDEVEIINGHVYVNNISFHNENQLKQKYLIKTSTPFNPTLLEKHGITEIMSDNEIDYIIFLTIEQVDYLSQKKEIISIDHILEMRNARDENIIQPQNTNWNMDFYGPVQIPKSGDILKLDNNNIKFYCNLITDFEGNTLDYDSNSIWINGVLTSSYEVQKNYYWTIGDNRPNSYDSRMYGFVPEEDIVGKALYIYWAKEKNRIGKIIN